MTAKKISAVALVAFAKTHKYRLLPRMSGAGSIVVLIDHQLRTAIAQKRLIDFTYQGMRRIAEPHDYGIQHGGVHLLVYQVWSVPFQRGWRMLDVGQIEQLNLLEREFSGTRRKEHTHHYHWDTVFARVE